MDDRRDPGVRCPQCPSKHIERTFQHRTSSFECLSCGHQWTERRQALTDGYLGEVVHEAIEAICSATDLQALLLSTRHWARKLTVADGVTFVLRAGQSCYYAEEDAIAPLWKGQYFPLESCVSGWVMLHKRSVLISDIYTDERVLHDAYRPTFVKSMLMVPVGRTEPIAAIGAYWKVERAPLREHVQLIELLAEAVAVQLREVQRWSEPPSRQSH